MAIVPLSGTNIRLLSGVPFSNDYKHTRWFDTVTEQNNYFDARNVVHTMPECTFQRMHGKTFIKVNQSIDLLRTVNYVMFQNQPYTVKWFYGFVTELEYVQKNVTYVHFQLDVLQTWLFNINFKPSYVVREHRRLWNTDGTPVINTLDEGLAYGLEYDTVSIDNWLPFGDNFFLVIVMKEAIHGGSGATKEITPIINGSPQPLTYYVHPIKLDGTSPNVQESGTTVTMTPIIDVLKALYKMTDAVNNIVSLYVTEHVGKDISYNSTTDTLNFSSANFSHEMIQDSETTVNTFYVKDIKAYDGTMGSFGNKYTGYTTPTESKLLMYPYTVLILDDFKGNRVEFKNEYIDSQNLIVTARGSLGTSNKVAYSIEQYGAPNISGSDLLLLSLEKSLISNNPNDVPIITDMLSAYLQGNRNSLENQRNSILFNGAMGAIGSGLGVATGAMMRNPFGIASSVVEMGSGLGNTALQLQGMQAKQMDINNTPPQITKMGANTAFDYGNKYNGLFIIKKQIKPEYRVKLEDYFNMFGYKTNEVKVPNLHTRASWNYVQTSSCNITGDFNNEDLRELKAVFDNGITLWHVDDVGNYDLGNGVI